MTGTRMPRIPFAAKSRKERKRSAGRRANHYESHVLLRDDRTVDQLVNAFLESRFGTDPRYSYEGA